MVLMTSWLLGLCIDESVWEGFGSELVLELWFLDDEVIFSTVSIILLTVSVFSGSKSNWQVA